MQIEEAPTELYLSNACRICLQAQESPTDMISIYEQEDDENDNDDESESRMLLMEKIEICGGIQITKDPQLPSSICQDCHKFLKFVLKFRKICSNSNELLQGFLEQEEENDEGTEDANSEYLIDPPSETNQAHDVFHAIDDTKQFQYSDIEIDTNPPIEYAEEPDHYQFLLNKHESKIIKAKEEKVDETKKEIYAEYCIEDEQLSSTDDFIIEEEILVPDSTEDCDEDFILDNMSYEPNTSVPDENQYENEDTDMPSSEPVQEEDRSFDKTLDITKDGDAIIRFKAGRKPRKKPGEPLVCDICGNCYKKRTALDAHRRRHNEIKNYECEICHKKFAFNFQVERHMRMHTGEKPYKCEYCDRRFVDRSTMGRHQKIHRNEREYTCEICQKSFTYYTVLKTHMTTHTGEKPFSCGICDKRFPRAHDLRQHLERQQHRNDPRTKFLIENIRPDNDW